MQSLLRRAVEESPKLKKTSPESSLRRAADILLLHFLLRFWLCCDMILFIKQILPKERLAD
jgi:hypothetical protein